MRQLREVAGKRIGFDPRAFVAVFGGKRPTEAKPGGSEVSVESSLLNAFDLLGNLRAQVHEADITDTLVDIPQLAAERIRDLIPVQGLMALKEKAGKESERRRKNEFPGFWTTLDPIMVDNIKGWTGGWAKRVSTGGHDCEVFVDLVRLGKLGLEFKYDGDKTYRGFKDVSEADKGEGTEIDFRRVNIMGRLVSDVRIIVGEERTYVKYFDPNGEAVGIFDSTGKRVPRNSSANAAYDYETLREQPQYEFGGL